MANINKIEPKVQQFRFYNFNNKNNNPTGMNWIGSNGDNTKSVDLLTDIGSAVKIGIQTLPGVRFFFFLGNLSDPIIIDHTGVYELDLRNTTTSISSLFFDPQSLARVSEIENASLIVDVLCNPYSGTVNA